MTRQRPRRWDPRFTTTADRLANLDVHSASTLGLKLVAIFTEQVGGTIDLEREGGTRFRLRFTPGAPS